jgi:(1->4)-alpha-D-glucan 1-alpha-D-glucosylmutase
MIARQDGARRTSLEYVYDSWSHGVRRMIAAEELDGLRVDHPDGLRDPARYCRALRQMLPEGRIYVEKILDSDEGLPTTWSVDLPYG